MVKFYKSLLRINKVYGIVLFITLCFSALNTKAQGLLFKSNDSLLTKRTSLHVFKSDIPEFQDHFFISFDLSLWDNANLGYIFNLADKDNSYSLSYLYNNGAGYLNFNIDSKSNKISIPLKASFLKKKLWNKVRVDFDLQADKVTISINNQTYHATGFGFKDKIEANITFGKNQYYTEVPDMAIKNLEVSDGSKDYLFPLDEWNGISTHDANGDVTGFVENPVWLINASYFWNPVYTQSFSDVAGLNFNLTDQNLFIFSKDSLVTYDSESRRVTTTAYKNKLPVPMVLGKSIFNARENKCYIYELFDVPKGMPSVAALNMDKNNLNWQTIGKATLPYQLHHHNIFYDLKQDEIYLFGGYGNYNYHNAFLKYNDTVDKWQNVVFTGDKINPRFFAATGPSDKDDEILLFGGYGNESGKQIIGGKQTYDLYRINLKTHTVKKCWDIKPGKEVFVPANNLILSADKQYFYALCYPHEVAKTELKLYRFSIKDGSYEVVSAPIPVTSMRIESDINLFFNHKTDEFFCTVQEFFDRKKSTIKVYSLAYPPVSNAAYLKSLIPQGKSWGWLMYGGLLVALAAIGAALVIWYNKRPRPRAEIPEVATQLDLDLSDDTREVEKKRNAVYLLGEFLVFDKNGRDITYLFSPKIKQLFILILLNSFDGKGIGSRKISSILWPDKDVAKTKNIKGVTFNHLRNIIGDIEGIELVFLNDNYSFTISDGFFCDYCLLTELFKGLGEEAVAANLHLIIRGPFLKDMSDSWLDDFKYAYEEQLIGRVMPELKKQYELRELKPALEMAKLILSIAPFNDEALKYQLKSYRMLKGTEYSRKIYDSFALEYKRSMGADYPVEFEKIVQ